MAQPRTVLDLFDVAPLVATSRVSFGKRLRVRGIPAVLFGVAAIVLARGASSALQKAMVILPESLREARSFWLAVRDDGRQRLS